MEDNHAACWAKDRENADTISVLQEEKHGLEELVAANAKDVARLSVGWRECERRLEARISECEDAHETLQQELTDTIKDWKTRVALKDAEIGRLHHILAGFDAAKSVAEELKRQQDDVNAEQHRQSKLWTEPAKSLDAENHLREELEALKQELEDERADRMVVEHRMKAAQAESERFRAQFDQISGHTDVDNVDDDKRFDVLRFESHALKRQIAALRQKAQKTEFESSEDSNAGPKNETFRDEDVEIGADKVSLFDFEGISDQSVRHLQSELGSQSSEDDRPPAPIDARLRSPGQPSFQHSTRSFDEDDTLVEQSGHSTKLLPPRVQLDKIKHKRGRDRWILPVINFLVLAISLLTMSASLHNQSLALQEREMWRSANAVTRRAAVHLRQADQISIDLGWLNAKLIGRLLFA